MRSPTSTAEEDPPAAAPTRVPFAGAPRQSTNATQAQDKIKHKHKKVKLRTLQYYKVDDSGKVQRLRKECPQCGPGVFFAAHFDRLTCGACGLTYMYKEGEAPGAKGGGKKGKK